MNNSEPAVVATLPPQSDNTKSEVHKVADNRREALQNQVDQMTKLQVIEQAGNRIRKLQDDIAKLQAQIDTKNRVINNLSNNQKSAGEMELMKARDEGRRIVDEANSYYQRKKAEADDVLMKAKSDAQEIINSNTQVVRSDIRKLENTRGKEKQRAVQFLNHLLDSYDMMSGKVDQQGSNIRDMQRSIRQIISEIEAEQFSTFSLGDYGYQDFDVPEDKPQPGMTGGLDNETLSAILDDTGSSHPYDDSSDLSSLAEPPVQQNGGSQASNSALEALLGDDDMDIDDDDDIPNVDAPDESAQVSFTDSFPPVAAQPPQQSANVDDFDDSVSRFSESHDVSDLNMSSFGIDDSDDYGGFGDSDSYSSDADVEDIIDGGTNNNGNGSGKPKSSGSSRIRPPKMTSAPAEWI